MKFHFLLMEFITTGWGHESRKLGMEMFAIGDCPTIHDAMLKLKRYINENTTAHTDS